ncbi:ankyrin repeat domain-containing protein [Quatrionicoccus australiensis]|uniref:ankyrin repeat domain-containing protein n=1 Tax=Quatrionicoccus australiensis TaxID=138118 RepID=UPI001CFA9E98|nr:ankyrin repeat domain-containing protein [Quatrionicoccus australiensis]MCB4361505.1 hypothetical protein [Quatrionicoccus australiensis]
MMTKHTLQTGIAFALSIFAAASVQAAKPDDATMELQYRFPICSEVLEAKRDTGEQTDAEKDLLEGSELLLLLNQYKRQRADLNAYFRQGTPLHHAACAGWNTEVLWLLRNGADPFLEASGYDALGVAVRTENWEVANTVLKHYQRLLGTASVSEKQQAQIHASVESAASQVADVGDKAAQYQRLLKKVGWKPSPKAWGKKYGELLCSGKAKAALDIVKALPWGRAAPVEIADANWTCPTHFNGRRSAEVLPEVADMPHWSALDALLPNPVLLPLVPLLPSGKGKAVLRTGIGHGLRAPWSSQELATIYFLAVLSRRDTPVGEEPALLRLIPQNDLPKVLEASQTRLRFHFTHYNDPLGGVALLHAGAWPLADLEWLIAQLTPSLIKQVQEQLHQWPDRVSAAHWEKLTPHLVAPLAIPYGYPKSLPYALWSKWMALGALPARERSTAPGQFTYTWSHLLASIPIPELAQGLAAARQLKGAAPEDWPTETDWAGLLLRAKPQELPGFLALAKAQRPDLLPRFMDWALAPLSFGPTPDAVALALTPPSLNRFGSHSGVWDRVRSLAGLGYKARHPRYPIQNLSEADRSAPSLQEAIQNAWLIAPPNTTAETDTANPGSVQWTKPLLTCHKQVDSGLRRALATSGQGGDPDGGDSEYLVPVQVTGLGDCQWLKVGGRFPGRHSWIDHDFFEGETEQRANAADGHRSAMFWHRAQQTFLDSGVEPNSGEAMLMHQSGQLAPWVAISGSVDWGQFSNDIFRARLQHNNTVVLEPLPTDHPGRISLMERCGSELLLDGCEALKEALQDDESRGIAQFADTYWPQARQDFLDALLSNDRASLIRMREEGLFSHWLSAGLRALGEARALSVIDKRRRAAWILALGSPRAAYDAATLDSLLTWLPPEDWRPIVKQLRCYPREQLLEKVKQTKDHTLSSRLQHEMNRFACEGA